jgi:predicted nucleotidyltransferase
VTVDRERVLEILRAQRGHIEQQYGLRMIGIVGSVARGEATAESDIDIWADIVRTPSLFQIAGAENELKDAVGAGLRVEFVFREDLRPAMRARMERDIIPL